MCGGSILGRGGAEAGIDPYLGKVEFIPGSGANVGAVEGIVSRNPLPIVIYNILVERDSPERVVRWSFAESVRDRWSVWERFLLAPDDAKIYDG